MIPLPVRTNTTRAVGIKERLRITTERVAIILLVVVLVSFFSPFGPTVPLMHDRIRIGLLRNNRSQKILTYDRSSPLIFIGGMPRSGTTLMRALLDAHPDVRCGEETRVIPQLMVFRQGLLNSNLSVRRLDAAGVKYDVLDSAFAAFVLEIIVGHGEAADRFCDKDPFTLKYALYLSDLFPNSKFLFMVRDGRATVHSMIIRGVSVSGFDLSSYRKSLTKWNAEIERMFSECVSVGPVQCMLVYYEQLVLHPEMWIRKVVQFLGLDWDEAMLHHDALVGKSGGVSLSNLEFSSDQVIKPINVDALTRWVGNIPNDIIEDLDAVAPMIRKLGYELYNVSNYGTPDDIVINNTKSVHAQRSYWLEKGKSVVAADSYPGKVLMRLAAKEELDVSMKDRKNLTESES